MSRIYVTDNTFFAWCAAFDEVGGFSGLTAQAVVDDLCAAIEEYIEQCDGFDETLGKANKAVVEVFTNCIFEHCDEDANLMGPIGGECTYQLASWSGKHLYETRAYVDEYGDVQVGSTWRGCTSAKGGA